MFLGIYLATVVLQLPVDVRAGENRLTTLDLVTAPTGLTFDWADADDVLRGTLEPRVLRVGAPVRVSAMVGPLQGAPFEGPVTFSLRPLGAMGSTLATTVPPAKGERRWATEFVVAEPGDYRFEVSWRSTHLKVVRGVITVQPAGLPGWVPWTVGSGLLALAIGIGLWLLFGRKEA